MLQFHYWQVWCILQQQHIDLQHAATTQPPRSHHAVTTQSPRSLPVSILTHTTQSTLPNPILHLFAHQSSSSISPLTSWWNVPYAPSTCVGDQGSLPRIMKWMHNHPLALLLLHLLYASSHHSFFLSLLHPKVYDVFINIHISNTGKQMTKNKSCEWLVTIEKQLLEYDSHPILSLNILLSPLVCIFLFFFLLTFSKYYCSWLLFLILKVQEQEGSCQLTQPKNRRLLFLRYFFLFFLLLVLSSSSHFASSLSYFFCSRFVSCFIFFLVYEFHLVFICFFDYPINLFIEFTASMQQVVVWRACCSSSLASLGKRRGELGRGRGEVRRDLCAHMVYRSWRRWLQKRRISYVSSHSPCHTLYPKKKREREKKGGRSERREGEGEGEWMKRWRIREHRRVNQHNLDSRE